MLAFHKESSLMAAKFRGCLVGALLGDCFGAPYEGDSTVSKSILQKYFDRHEDPKFKTPLKSYTDDTVMSTAIAESYVQNKGFNELDLAKRFVSNFFKEPRRGYGMNVVDVFKQLKISNFEDVWGPAKNMFGGAGSFGNGGAMRIAPVALWHQADYSSMIKDATQCTQITHTNHLGVNGALLQCIAVNMCFKLNPQDPVDTQNFTNELMEKISEIEEKKKLVGDEEKPYWKQLSLMSALLQEDAPDADEVTNILGNSTAALYSVPTAVYAFLKAQNPIPDIQTDNPFRRVIQLSISLGGDTDTIASMAGAMAGAYQGIDYIDPVLQSHCEGLADATQLSYQLLQSSLKRPNS